MLFSMLPRKFVTVTIAALALMWMVAGSASAARAVKIQMPDFTRGDAIPDGATHDWNLGPTGARGWMYSNNMSTSEARQVYITKVAAGSPAEGVLKVGDVILGVGGKPFSYDPRTEFGKAITAAEAGSGNLALRRWRKGNTQDVTVRLPVLGTYSDTAPYDCAKSRRIVEQGCAALVKTMNDERYRPNPIVRSLNALALLASGNPDYLPLVKREAQWASEFSAESFQTWWYGFTITLLAEYVMQTGDQSVMPGLKRLAMEAANGQSIVGSWGHKFAGPDGRLGGYGMMNAPGLPLTAGLILARQAGVSDPRLDRAILRSERMLRFYVGKGSVPYGDHSPWIQTHEDNGKNGIAAIMFNLLDDAKATEYFSRMSVASHGAERDYGHTGNYFNILWALPGVSLSGPQATGAWMKQFGAWYFDLARCWDGTFVHQGGEPMVRPDKYRNWDCTGAYLLAYTLPLKKLRLTGKPSVAPQIDADTAKALIQDGIGWTRKDRYSYYDKLTTEQLLGRLSSWSPIVRERAADALGRRKAEVTDPLIAMLDASSLHTRIGACQALAKLKEQAASAVPALSKTLDADDLWLRIKAAEALAAIGEPAMSVLPKMLAMLADYDRQADPRGMQQRYFTFALFNRGGMLGRSLEGVDREALYAAIRAGLRNEDGRARGSFGSVYQQLPYDQIEPLLPDIYRAVVEPAPSGIMFADGIRLAGLEVLAKHRIKEGLPLCIELVDVGRWGLAGRIKRCLNTLRLYGGAARSEIPNLRALVEELKEKRRWKAEQLEPLKIDEIIEQIENDKNPPKLRSLKQ